MYADDLALVADQRGPTEDVNSCRHGVQGIWNGN